MIKKLCQRVLLANPIALVGITVAAVAAGTVAFWVRDLATWMRDVVTMHSAQLVQVGAWGMVVGFLMVAVALPAVIREWTR